MRRAYVGVTDQDWFEFLSHRPDLPEVNFWQPGGRRAFTAIAPGDLFLFKLHSPNNFIVGGGFVGASSVLPVSLAWETFGLANGVGSLGHMRERIERYRRERPKPTEDYQIGNTILEAPFFFTREAWIPIPDDFSLNIVQGKTYDDQSATGLALFQAVEARLQRRGALVASRMVSEAGQRNMFSDPQLARHRLGQGAFRILITDLYERRCAVTSEHTLPVLEAAHIRPVSLGGLHEVSNGLLLRQDVHTLFDRGYVTVTSDLCFRVSERLRADYHNGRVYYEFDRAKIHLPTDPSCWPSRDALAWHADTVFKG